MICEQRRKHEQSPHAIDDARDAGEQFDRDSERAAQDARREFGQKNSDAETHRDRDEQRDARGDQRADDGYQRAEFTGDRVPVGTRQETKTECMDGGQAAHYERSNDCRQKRQHPECGDSVRLRNSKSNTACRLRRASCKNIGMVIYMGMYVVKKTRGQLPPQL